MNSDDFLRLAAAGLTTEQIALVMEMMAREARVYADADEARKAKGRERVAKWRETRNVTETQPKVTVPLTGGDARVEDKTSNQDIEPQKKEQKDAPGRDLSDFKAELADLDPERLNAIIKHRRSKRGQCTGLAARLFRGDAESCGLSLEAAVDTCISRNWITVKPEYFRGRTTGPPERPPTTADVAARLLSEMRSANGQPGTSDSRHPQALVAIPGGKHAGYG